MTRSTTSHVNDKLSYDDQTSFWAVRSATVAFAAANPTADRDAIMSHLKDAGFGNSSYPVKKWIREAQTDDVTTAAEIAAARDAAAADHVFLDDVRVPSDVDPVSPKADKYNHLGDHELARVLLDHVTVSDKTWTARQSRSRLPKEKRSDYIITMLGDPA